MARFINRLKSALSCLPPSDPDEVLEITVHTAPGRPVFLIRRDSTPMQARLIVKNNFGYQDNGLTHTFVGVISQRAITGGVSLAR